MSFSQILSKTIENLEGMNQLAAELIHKFRSGDIVVLSGDLGAGKTTFVQFFCKQLGIADDVTSPTFTIINEYQSGSVPVYHFDFYRLKDVSELKGLNLDDYLFGEGICFMEWGEKIEDVLPFPHYHLDITINNNHKRKMELTVHDQ